MIFWYRVEAELRGEVNNARGVFVVRTLFLAFLPYESYVCVMGDATHRRRRRAIAADRPRHDTVKPVLDYASNPLQRKTAVKGYYALPSNVSLSLLAAYMRICALLFPFVSLMSLAVYESERWPAALAACLLFAVLAPILFLLPKSRLFQDISYERAVRLAALASCPESVMRDLQVQYDRTCDCDLVHGLPVSSTLILYAYVDDELPKKLAARIAQRVHSIAFGRRWAFPELWPIHRWTINTDGSTQRDLGFIVSIPQDLPAEWESHLDKLTAHLVKLSRRFHITFAVGLSDLRGQSNHDLLIINAEHPNLTELKEAIRTQAAHRTSLPQ